MKTENKIKLLSLINADIQANEGMIKNLRDTLPKADFDKNNLLDLIHRFTVDLERDKELLSFANQIEVTK